MHLFLGAQIEHALLRPGVADAFAKRSVQVPGGDFSVDRFDKNVFAHGRDYIAPRLFVQTGCQKKHDDGAGVYYIMSSVVGPPVGHRKAWLPPASQYFAAPPGS